MIWQNEVTRAAAVSLLFLVIFAAAEIWRRGGNPETEKTRKLVHFASGAVCLSFAYLFRSQWTVLALCTAFVGIMIVSKRFGLLQSVHGIKRTSSGGIYYPMAIYFTFFIACIYDRPHFYLIAILVLALSDSLAALIGGRYGFKVYRVEEDFKSLEGSVVFFLVTFIVVHVGLLLLTPIGRLESLLAAAYLSLLVTAFESISLGGADNIFIPIGTIAVLIRTAEMPAETMAVRIGIVIALFVAVHCISRRTGHLGLTAVIAIAMVGYAAYALAGQAWVIPILVGTFLFIYLDIFVEPRTADTNDIKFHIRPTFYVLCVSFTWILIALLAPGSTYVFFVPYVANLTASLGIFWQRRSRITDRPYHQKLPQWIRHAPLPLRALILSLLLAMPTALLDRRITVCFAFPLTILCTMGIESTYWRIECAKRGKWSNTMFLRMTAALSMAWTFAATVVSAWYYRLDHPICRWIAQCLQ